VVAVSYAVPAGKPAAIRAYAVNPRSGYAAIGSLQLIEPPKPPVPVAAKPAEPARVPAKHALAPPTAARPAGGARTQPDSISRIGFDTATRARARTPPPAGGGSKPNKH
jgi:hypothetical protein